MDRDRRFTVLIEWEDALDKDHIDADELQVWAKTAACAVQKAKKDWRLTIGAKWPRCVVTSARILPSG